MDRVIEKGAKMMSTRCQIGFYRHEKQALKCPVALLYVHNDGRPDFILPKLIASLQQVESDNRLDDIETASAKVLYDLMHEHARLFNRSFSPFGICQNFHGDIKFYYAIYSSGTVKALSVNHLGKFVDEGKGVRTLKTVNIKNEPRNASSAMKEKDEQDNEFVELLSYWRSEKEEMEKLKKIVATLIEEKRKADDGMRSVKVV